MYVYHSRSQLLLRVEGSVFCIPHRLGTTVLAVRNARRRLLSDLDLREVPLQSGTVAGAVSLGLGGSPACWEAHSQSISTARENNGST
jgi:hypothetical protein